MKLNVSEDWYRKMAEAEDDAEIGAGGILAEPSVPVAALREILRRYQTECEITGVWVVARLEALCDAVEPKP